MPLVEQPGTDLWAIYLEYVGLGFKFVLSLVYPGFNLLVFLKGGAASKRGAIIVKAACRKLLLSIVVFFKGGALVGKRPLLVVMTQSLLILNVSDVLEYKKNHGPKEESAILHTVPTHRHPPRLMVVTWFSRVTWGGAMMHSSFAVRAASLLMICVTSSTSVFSLEGPRNSCSTSCGSWGGGLILFSFQKCVTAHCHRVEGVGKVR